MTLAAFIVDAVRVYALIGLCLAAIFLAVGIGRITPDARGSYVFRPLLIPGVVLLWPVVLLRWSAIERGARAVPDRMESFAPEKPPAFQRGGHSGRAACGAKCPGSGQAAYLPPRRAQGWVALAMAALIVAVVAMVFAMRSEPRVERAPVLLEAPKTPTGEP
ncbi:MAG: hypothetical protein AAF580_14400 [Pseudomonadota bacterium]